MIDQIIFLKFFKKLLAPYCKKITMVYITNKRLKLMEQEHEQNISCKL